MESKPEEEKKSEEQKPIEPNLELKKAFEELGIDPKAPDFSLEKTVELFK